MSTTNPTWNPGVAAVLSLIIPGAGQIYKGQIFNGLFWLVVVVIGYFALVVPGVILHIFCIIGAASGKKAVVDPDKPTPQTHVKCPECAELVRKEAMKCKHCGCALVPQK